jgi:hypothetical protein
MVGSLTMENELLKGCRVHNAAEKRAFITNHRQDFGIERGCESDGAFAQHVLLPV